jgi:hypothetical protein
MFEGLDEFNLTILDKDGNLVPLDPFQQDMMMLEREIEYNLCTPDGHLGAVEK